jgi:hypothetical protein
MGIQQVNNLGTNYVLYYNIVNYWKTIMSNHPSIQRVTLGDNWALDSEEFPQYPIGNILVTNVRFAEKKILYTIQLTLADKIKDKNNESIGSSNDQSIPFFGTDDTVDIHANTLSILNDLLVFTKRNTMAFNFISEPMAVPFKNEMPNGLAGWVCTMELEAFNQEDACLYPNLLTGGLEIKGVQTDC